MQRTEKTKIRGSVAVYASGLWAKMRNEKSTQLLLFLALISFCVLCFAFFYGVTPAAGSDNYIYSMDAQSLILKGFDTLGWGVLGVKYTLIFGEAFFMALLGAAFLWSCLRCSAAWAPWCACTF